MKKIWTIGHSTRTIEDFIKALQANEIQLVADVRTLPGSRRHPQFNQEPLRGSLAAAGISYQHFVNAVCSLVCCGINYNRSVVSVFEGTPISWRQRSS